MRPRETVGDTAIDRGRRVLAYVLLMIVLGAVAAMSWSGLYGFAHQTMGWSPVHAALVPIALDVAAMACAFLALDSIGRGETAVTFRTLTGALVGLSAFVNWRHAISTGNIAEQVFFPAMSIIAYALVHATLGKYRREVRRDLSGRQHRETLEPLPRVGALAWARYPGRAFGAVSQAIAERLPASDSPSDATRRRDVASGYLLGLSQADAIRKALETVGAEDPRAVVAWLAENGRPVAPQRVYDVIRRDRGKHELRAVPGGKADAAEENAS